ncbi:MAG: protein kinase [Deltaproteobacteria bacterium]|nr:protein kinase [Deltaproteobacteria bacterium]
MAEILLARQRGARGVEKLVVVKRILEHLAEDAEFVQMFLNEARLAASVRHPNIVEIYDVYRDASEFFIVMEYLSGEDLIFILRKARHDEFTIPTEVVCRVVADVAAGLEAAHTANDVDGNALGLVHRDIGPSNIILTYAGVTKLVDFGVAKANIANVYTRPGTMKGKLAYSSPEQIQHETLDARSDVFSLGIVLHEMLTGHRLFRGTNPASVLRAVMESEVLPPSKLNHVVPPELDLITLAALTRSRSKRTPTAGMLREQLEAVIKKREWNVGQQEVARWTQQTFAEAYASRLELEKTLLTDDRAIPAADGPDPPELPPAFNRSDPGRRSISSHGSAGSASGSYHDQPLRRGLLIASTALATVLVMGSLGFAYWLGHGGAERPQVAAPRTQQAGRALAPTATPPQDDVALLLHVVPEGAQAVVNGQRLPQTIGIDGVLIPVAASREVELKISKAGYADDVRHVVAPDRGTRNVYATLTRLEDAVDLDRPATERGSEASRRNGLRRAPPPRPARKGTPRPAPVTLGSLSIEYDPPDATLSLDGDVVAGTSPQLLSDIPPGKHRVRIEADGYKPRERALLVEAGQEHSLRIELLPNGPEMARIDISTTPPGATITINGKRTGRSPVTGLQLEAETEYDVKTSLSGYATASTHIVPTAGANPPIVVTLTALPAAAPAPPPMPTPPLAPPKPPPADVTVARDVIGNAANGAGLIVSACGQCHGRVAPRLDSKHYTRDQWSRYFANSRHSRRGTLAAYVSAAQLADVKAYLMLNAADVGSDVAAGVK